MSSGSVLAMVGVRQAIKLIGVRGEYGSKVAARYAIDMVEAT